MEATVLLDVDGLTKRYGGVVANDAVDLSVGEGEIVALLGENGAGKSTFVRLVYGLARPDSGRIRWRGDDVRIDSARDALAAGIGLVPQHDLMVPTMTGAENLELSRNLTGRLLDLDASRAKLAELSREFGLDVDVDLPVERLTVGQRQWLSLLRVLVAEVDLLFLDEITANLTPSETESLFASLGRLRAQGRGVVLITHRLSEVFAIADRVVVMRQGRKVGDLSVAETDERELARLMVGRLVERVTERSTTSAGEVALEARGLGLDGEERLDGVDLVVRRHEIVGIAGVDGNGQRPLVEAVMGLRSLDRGTVLLHGRVVDGGTPDRRLRAEMARIPEDRHRHGLALDMTLWENVHLGRIELRHLTRRGLMDDRRARDVAGSLLGRFGVRASSVDQQARELSGGNQQKVVVARELSDDAALVVAMNPTRGLDIQAAAFVHEQLVAVRDRGGAVLFVSFDLEEILLLSDRVLVMSGGAIVGGYDRADHDPDRLALLMGGAVLR